MPKKWGSPTWFQRYSAGKKCPDFEKLRLRNSKWSHGFKFKRLKMNKKGKLF